MWLDILNEKHYKALYEVHKRAEKIAVPTFMQFAEVMHQREGFVVVTPGGKLAGCIAFSDYVPGMDIVINCFIDPLYRNRWAIRRNIYRQAFDFPFETLSLRRVTAYVVIPINEDVSMFLRGLGFSREGLMRKRVAMPETKELCDVEIYGLLKEDRRW